MADVCTAVEELSFFFVIGRKMALLSNALRKAKAVSIYLAIVKCIKDKNLQVGNVVGMGFDGAAIFSGNDRCLSKTKEHAPQVVFVHCHLLQLACMKAANSTTGIKHVYTTLTTLWKYFHYSP